MLKHQPSIKPSKFHQLQCTWTVAQLYKSCVRDWRLNREVEFRGKILHCQIQWFPQKYQPRPIYKWSACSAWILIQRSLIRTSLMKLFEFAKTQKNPVPLGTCKQLQSGHSKFSKCHHLAVLHYWTNYTLLPKFYTITVAQMNTNKRPSESHLQAISSCPDITGIGSSYFPE